MSDTCDTCMTEVHCLKHDDMHVELSGQWDESNNHRDAIGHSDHEALMHVLTSISCEIRALTCAILARRG